MKDYIIFALLKKKLSEFCKHEKAEWKESLNIK